MVMLIGGVLLDARILLEFDPDVVAVCERPRFDIAIVRSQHSREVDFWVLRQNKAQHGVVVHSASRKDKNITLGVLESSIKASTMNCQIWAECDLLRRRLLLRNLKQILPYLSIDGAVDTDLSNALEQVIRDRGKDGASLEELVQAHAQRHRTQVAASLFASFHKGRVSADLEHTVLTTKTRWLPT
jgi:hypothetical protein